MQKEIHPQYNTEATVECACGHKFTVGSTKKDIHVEVCSNCHPFFTGLEKVMDTAGRVEKFKTRQSKAGETKVAKPKKATVKTKK
ncbi:MAG TPA: 50S ribosomal protein L31 [Candidatus Paceibacterota bacterium]|jgi:large subunit ribosomal protein L31